MSKKTLRRLGCWKQQRRRGIIKSPEPCCRMYLAALINALPAMCKKPKAEIDRIACSSAIPFSHGVCSGATDHNLEDMCASPAPRQLELNLRFTRAIFRFIANIQQSSNLSLDCAFPAGIRRILRQRLPSPTSPFPILSPYDVGS